jgi:UDP-N-acetylglucosamine 2-epimerase (non-hydrolysing)
MRVLAVIGTRPEAIKMAPLVRALNRDGRFETRVCLTGQHRELLDQVIRVFELPVHHDLNVMQPGQSVHDITSRVLRGMRDAIAGAKPQVLLVHGDTTTSFAAALAGYYAKLPVGHVEAGLRTQDKYSPFPEEMNRRLCDALCDYHYAPTEGAREHLRREGICGDHVLVTGNTVIDALMEVAAMPYEFEDVLLQEAGTKRKLMLVTAHRRESFGAPFREMCLAIRDLVRANRDLEAIYPVHPNPSVCGVAHEVLDGEPRVHLIAPLEYVPFVHLLKKAHIVLTDSGGIQEEAPSLGKPVLVMREVTERPEAIAAGTAQLVGNRYTSILHGVQRLLDDPAAYAAMARAANPYGDGKASARIVAHLAAQGAKAE